MQCVLCTCISCTRMRAVVFICRTQKASRNGLENHTHKKTDSPYKNRVTVKDENYNAHCMPSLENWEWWVEYLLWPTLPTHPVLHNSYANILTSTCNDIRVESAHLKCPNTKVTLSHLMYVHILNQ